MTLVAAAGKAFGSCHQSYAVLNQTLTRAFAWAVSPEICTSESSTETTPPVRPPSFWSSHGGDIAMDLGHLLGERRINMVAAERGVGAVEHGLTHGTHHCGCSSPADRWR
jgi:hypothetical protein